MGVIIDLIYYCRKEITATLGFIGFMLFWRNNWLKKQLNKLIKNTNFLNAFVIGVMIILSSFIVIRFFKNEFDLRMDDGILFISIVLMGFSLITLNKDKEK